MKGASAPFLFGENKLKKVMDRDAVTGKTTVFHSHEHDDTYAVEDRQDVTQIIKDATIKRNETDKHTRYGDGLNKVASIPMSMYQDWVKKRLHERSKENERTIELPRLQIFQNPRR